MVGTYEISLGGAPVGKVTVSKEKLYYHFHCRCKLSGAVVFQLTAETEQGHEHIGILAPEGDAFTLRTKLPVKRFPKGITKFILQPRHESVKGRFVPLSPESPFPYLDRLEKAFLAAKDGKTGIMICD